MTISQAQMEETKHIVCFVYLIHFKKFPPTTAQEIANELELTFNKKLLPAIRNICGEEVEIVYRKFFNEEDFLDKEFAEYLNRKSVKLQKLLAPMIIGGLSARDPNKPKKLPKRQVGIPGND